MFCPNCGFENLDSTTYCIQCGAPLVESKKSLQGAQKKPPKSEQDSLGSMKMFTKGYILGGRYQILSEVGRGGMGRVFKAIDNELEKEVVALKVLLPQFSSDEKVMERFKRETRIARRITHPNVLRIYDLGQEGESLYISMELGGLSLDNILKSKGPMPVGQVVGITKQLCWGLNAAHHEGIIHRDIKPQNILIEDNNHVKIADFGIARADDMSCLTTADLLMGTPNYMSPEQVIGDAQVDERSDIYSLGVVLFEMLTGSVPFHAETPTKTAFMHVQVKPPPPRTIKKDIPQWMENIVLKALEKDPAARFQSVIELANAMISKSVDRGASAEDDKTIVTQEKITDPLIGRIIKGSYRIEGLLAEGDMSRIYIAEQLSLSRQIVIKMPLARFADQEFIDLFLREARINSQLNHNNVLSIIDFGITEDNLVFLAMEYLDGNTLGEIVENQQGLTLSKIIWVTEQLCDGVHAAHKLGIGHRDLDPSNVMIARMAGDVTVVKVVNFSISKLMAEQIEGKHDIDARADVYAIGAVLYFMAAGKRPFSDAGSDIIMNKQLGETQTPPPLAKEDVRDSACLLLQPVIDKAMTLDRNQRYDSVEALWDDFLSHVNQGADLSYKQDAPPTIGEPKFQFEFRGEVVEGNELEQVKKKLAAVFKFSAQQIEALFSGKRVVPRKNISRKGAERYHKLFTKCGAKGYVEEMEEATRIAPHPHSSKQPSLPGGGLAQPLTVSDLLPSKKINTTTGGSVMPSSVVPGSAVGGKPASKKLLKITASFIFVLIMLASVIYAVPNWRYHISDEFMLFTGAMAPQRGIDTHTIHLGMSAAFSGSAKELGRSMQIGVETYIKQVNDAGGVHGRNIELKSLDDGYEPAQAVANMESFLDRKNGVFALIGNVGTPTSKAILPIILDKEIILFGAFSGAEILRRLPPDRYIFNYRASYAQETAAIIHYFVKIKGIDPRDTAVFYQDDSFGRDGLSGVANALLEYDVPIEQIVTATYQRNTRQVASALDHMKPYLGKLKAIVVVGTYSASAEFTEKMRLAGYKGEFANVSFVGSRALAELFQEMGGNMGKGVIVSQVVPMYDAHATGVLNYHKALKTYFPSEPPNFISLEGYMSAAIFIEALRRTGRYFTTESLVNTLESIQGLDLGVGTDISFSSLDHQASQRVWGSMINETGKFVPLDFEKSVID